MYGGRILKTRKLSIPNKLIILISAIIIISIMIVGNVSYGKASEYLIQQNKSNAMSIASIAALEIDSDIHNEIKEGMEDSTDYQEIKDCLTKFRDNTDIEYIYTMRLLPDDSLVFVVDTDEEEPAAIFEEYEMLDEINLALNGEITADEEITTDEWGSYYSAYAPFYNEDGTVAGIVGVDVDINWINERLSSLRNLIVLITLLTVLIGLFCTILISHSIGRNLKKLNEKVLDIVEGNGDLTKKLDMSSGDELEVIADNMNHLIEDIRNLIKEVSEKSSLISADGDSIFQAAEDNTENVKEISSVSTNLSANMEETSASCTLIQEMVATAANDVNILAEKAHEIELNTLEMKDRAVMVANESEENKGNMDKKIKTFHENIISSVENAKKIEKISEMAKKIHGISEQTKILSMNASIEAARAGEAGRGFAVVAESMNDLSSNIMETVKEINETSKDVINAVDELITKSTELSDFIGVDVMKDYETLSAISTIYNEDAEQINSAMTAFKEKAGVINATVSSISQSVQEIDQAVAENTKEITELNSMADAVAESMQSLNNTAKGNKTNAENIKEKTNKYKC